MNKYVFNDINIGEFKLDNSVPAGLSVSIIGSSSNINVISNDLNNATNYIAGTNLNINIFDKENINKSIYLFNNSIGYSNSINKNTYSDTTNNYNRKFNKNDILNFPNLSIKIRPNEFDYENILPSNNESLVNYFYKESIKYNPNDKLIISPTFLNDGQKLFWGEATNQRVLYNLNFEITTVEKLTEFLDILPRLPKNLNNNILDISFNLTEMPVELTYIEFNNFFGGTVYIHRR